MGADFERKRFDERQRILRPPSTKMPVICQRIVPSSKIRSLFPTHIVRHYMGQGGMRTRTSPHARVRVEIDYSAGELPSLPS